MRHDPVKLSLVGCPRMILEIALIPVSILVFGVLILSAGSIQMRAITSETRLPLEINRLRASQIDRSPEAAKVSPR